MFRSGTCDQNLSVGRCLPKACCLESLQRQFGRLVQPERRDILKKAVAPRFEVLQKVTTDMLGGYYRLQERKTNSLYLALDVDSHLVTPLALVIILGELCPFLEQLQRPFPPYYGYRITHGHVLLLFAGHSNVHPLRLDVRQQAGIHGLNKLLSLVLHTIAQIDTYHPNRYTAVGLCDPKRVLFSEKHGITLLFPYFHPTLVTESGFATIGRQMEVLRFLLHHKPEQKLNAYAYLDVFNLGWHLYQLATGELPEFNTLSFGPETWPLRPAKLNSRCPLYVEEIVMRSLLYPQAAPFLSVRDIYAFLRDFYQHHMAAKQAADSSRALHALATYYERVSRKSAKKNRWLGLAYDLYQQLLAEAPHNHDFLYGKANILYKSGRFSACKQAAKALIAAYPEDLQAYLLLGHVYLVGFADVAKAELCYQKICQLSPKHMALLELFKGQIHEKKGEITQARSIYEKLLHLDGHGAIQRHARQLLTGLPH